PPDAGVGFGLHDLADVIGVLKAADQADALLIAAGAAFGVFDGDIRGGVAQVIIEHLAHARDVTLPSIVIEQIAGVAIDRRVLVHDDEVGQHVIGAHVGEHDWGPTVVGGSSARVYHRMVVVVDG